MIKFLKLTAICSSIFLASGLVCYRAGALNWLIPEDQAPVTKNQQPPATEPASVAPIEPADMMSSSKSLVINPITPQRVGGIPHRPIMAGSKSAPVFPIETPPKDTDLAPVPDMMHSSKSGKIFDPTRAQPKPAQHQKAEPNK